jgi:hypothetical protein
VPPFETTGERPAAARHRPADLALVGLTALMVMVAHVLCGATA